MLILNQKEIWAALSFEEALTAMEEAFQLFEAGNFHMPDRMHAHHGDNTLLLMLCEYGNHQSVIPEISGTASITGQNEFYFDPNDPLKDGFIFR
jgi:ornithine cyclodeaminase/alanine dehydrogenase-like protein (mu-crystallin family)